MVDYLGWPAISRQSVRGGRAEALKLVKIYKISLARFVPGRGTADSRRDRAFRWAWILGLWVCYYVGFWFCFILLVSWSAVCWIAGLLTCWPEFLCSVAFWLMGCMVGCLVGLICVRLCVLV